MKHWLSATIILRGRNCSLVKHVKVKMSFWCGYIFSLLLLYTLVFLKYITLLQNKVKSICLTQRRKDLQPSWEMDIFRFLISAPILSVSTEDHCNPLLSILDKLRIVEEWVDIIYVDLWICPTPRGVCVGGEEGLIMLQVLVHIALPVAHREDCDRFWGSFLHGARMGEGMTAVVRAQNYPGAPFLIS